MNVCGDFKTFWKKHNFIIQGIILLQIKSSFQMLFSQVAIRL